MSNLKDAREVILVALENILEAAGCDGNSAYDESLIRISRETAEELEKRGLLAEDIL